MEGTGNPSQKLTQRAARSPAKPTIPANTPVGPATAAAFVPVLEVDVEATVLDAELLPPELLPPLLLLPVVVAVVVSVVAVTTTAEVKLLVTTLPAESVLVVTTTVWDTVGGEKLVSTDTLPIPPRFVAVGAVAAGVVGVGASEAMAAVSEEMGPLYSAGMAEANQPGRLEASRAE